MAELYGLCTHVVSAEIVCCAVLHLQVHPAPGPEEVNWQHVWMSGLERDLRTAFTWPLTLAVVLFPITLVTSAASRLEYVFCPTGQDNVSLGATEMSITKMEMTRHADLPTLARHAQIQTKFGMDSCNGGLGCSTR